RVAQAVSCALDIAGDVAHEALMVGAELLKLSPIPGLEGIGKAILIIWDSVQLVAFNRMQCLRLVKRSADIFISIREEISKVNDVVTKELQQPLQTFNSTLSLIIQSLFEINSLPGWVRYLKRDWIKEEINNCNIALSVCLNSFDVSKKIVIIVGAFAPTLIVFVLSLFSTQQNHSVR
ncbi:hypothetical protein AMATHDRAFT_154039, partial [Amanita thiersii Skay4041]